MEPELTITDYQINGMREAPVTDRGEIRAALWVEGPAETVSFRLYGGDGALLWESGALPWAPSRTLAGLPLEPCRAYRLAAEVSGSGARAEQVKDLRTGCETGNTAAVLDGDIDQFVEAYLRFCK